MSWSYSANPLPFTILLLLLLLFLTVPLLLWYLLLSRDIVRDWSSLPFATVDNFCLGSFASLSRIILYFASYCQCTTFLKPCSSLGPHGYFGYHVKRFNKKINKMVSKFCIPAECLPPTALPLVPAAATLLARLTA